MGGEVRDCFVNALKEEKRGKKHKGLLITKPNNKIPEEWFYTLYYCALAILAKFGIESRSQKCTASFLRYAKDNNLIDYDGEFIDRIIVYRNKEEKSDVDERETARYGSSVTSEEVESKYEKMTLICKKAISQAEEIVFSDKEFKVPKE